MSLNPRSHDAGRTGGADPLSPEDQRLIEACRRGDRQGVEEALRDDANVGVKFRQTLEEITPLVLACQRGYLDVVELLVDRGAQVNDKMGFGFATPLLQAVSNEHISIAGLLLDRGANVNQADKLGRTALMDAAENGRIDIVKLLVEKGADPDAVDNENRSALSYCLDHVSKDESRYFDICTFLVMDCKVDVNYRGRTTSRTLLHCAAARGDFDLVKVLVEEKRIQVDVTDSMGYAPITYATKAGHPDIAAYLQRANSDGCCIVL